MLDLFGTLSLGQRSLQTQRQGVEIAGHNMANVNNPAYTRQRLLIQSSQAVPSSIGPQGTGADGVAIQQLRSLLVDRQLQGEISSRGFLEAKQRALQYAQADLGQQINQQTSTNDSTNTTQGVSLAEGLSELFNAFQSLATNPTSIAERQVLMMKAENLATQFNQVDQRLDKLHDFLNESVSSDVEDANQLLNEIARLNDRIFNSEVGGSGMANDLRDTRQDKIEKLAELMNISSSEDPSGMVDISIDGQTLVSGNQLNDTIETYDAGEGHLRLRTHTAAHNLVLTGGSIQGTIEAREDDVIQLKSSLNNLASTLIQQINDIHSAGFGLSGSSGETFFTGANAKDIRANANLLKDPTLVQVSGSAATPGDNSNSLALAQLGNVTLASLNQQTFSQSYSHTVAVLGQALSSTNNQLSDQQVVEKLLIRQRDSYSGISLDEEMTDLMKYQKAFEASARLINTVDEMLDTVLSLKR